MVAVSLANSTGCRVGNSRMLVSSSIRSVTAAAAASAISESWLANATRSMVASVLKPCCSAWDAQVGRRVPGVPGTGLGSPIPIRMTKDGSRDDSPARSQSAAAARMAGSVR